MTEVLSIEYTEILNVTMTAHCRDCASRSDQHETQVNARSLHVRCEPRANSGGKKRKKKKKKLSHNFGVQMSLQLQIHFNTRHILKHYTIMEHNYSQQGIFQCFTLQYY